MVFPEDLEAYSHTSYVDILHTLIPDSPPDVINLGGPAIIALVHASQVLYNKGVEVFMYGAIGNDNNDGINT